MISKAKIQLIKSLRSSKFRSLHGKFIAEGPKIVSELLRSSFSISTIYATTDWIKDQPRIEDRIEISTVNDFELSRISNLASPNQVLAVINIPEPVLEIPAVNDFVLLLDGISDPGNMGTIIRTADWFGIQFIICSENCVDIFNPKVVQATAGSIFRIPVYYAHPEKYLKEISNKTDIFGALLDGENLYSVKSGRSGIIIIGSESHGISKELLPYITSKIRIPDYSKGQLFSAESLNASQATAVICAELKRRQNLEIKKP